MSRVYFEGWYSGAYVKAEDWYKDDLVYINVRLYWKSTAVSRPDQEKSFLVRFNRREQIQEWQHTIAAIFSSRDEHRDDQGRLVPCFCRLPDPLFQNVAVID